mgnify:CR=1 FL=1
MDISFCKNCDNILYLYKEDEGEDHFIVCKHQTCSSKLKSLEEVSSYLSNLWSQKNL